MGDSMEKAKSADLRKMFDELQKYIKAKDGDSSEGLTDLRKLVRNKHLMRMTDRLGYPPIHIAIHSEASSDKIAILLENKESVTQTYKGRLPLHVAIEQSHRDDVIHKLIDADHTHETVRTADTDMRLPLHMMLDCTPFPASFQNLSMRVLDLYPEAAMKMPHDRLPLHMAIENGLPVKLIDHILQYHPCAAAVPRKDGRLPLHIAVEKEGDPITLAKLVKAYPNALLRRTNSTGTDSVLINWAIRAKALSKPALKVLLQGGSPDDHKTVGPKVVAYARAAATGRANRDVRVEDLDFANHHKEGDHLTWFFSIKPFNLPATRMDMDIRRGPKEKVEELKIRIEEKFGVPRQRQRLITENGKRQLLHGYPLEHYDIKKETVILLTERFDILQDALKANLDEEIITELLGLHPDAATQDDQHGMLPLDLAIQCNASGTIIKKLLTQYPEAVEREVSGKFPLHHALERAYSPDIIKTLLTNVQEEHWTHGGIYNPNNTHFTGRPALPMHLAIINGAGRETLQHLIDSRCPVAPRNPVTGLSALECVLEHAREEPVFDIILNESLKVNPKAAEEAGPNGMRPLHVAVLNGAPVHAIEILCELAPAALEAYDIDGRLPLHIAVSRKANFANVEKLLRSNSSTARVMDAQGRTPLQLAVTHRAAPGVVLEIARTGSEVFDVRDNRGRTIIELAVAANAPSWVIQELLEVCPYSMTGVNLLSAKWENTFASSEALRVANRQRKEIHEHASQGPPSDLHRAAASQVRPFANAPRASTTAAPSSRDRQPSTWDRHLSSRDRQPTPEAVSSSGQEPEEQTLMGSFYKGIASLFY